jgi:peroxiredoxin Q/BCP
MLKVGDKAPDFKLNDGNGRSVKLSDLRGRMVVIYFYPKDDTPGCTREACNLRDGYKVLGKSAVVLGISMDSEDIHKKFSEKYGLPFQLLADVKGGVCKKYGVYVQKNMYGRKYWGIKRTTFVIDRTGKIKHIFGKVDVDNHADEIMEYVD